MANETAQNGKPVAALVISGFLGSGKTTLVSHLLAEAQAEGVRLAVVSNEFAALGVDKAILGDGVADYVELDGGCVCCKLGDELVETLAELREKVDPDRIVIETSGVALPYDTLLHLWRDPVRHWIVDEASIVVVAADQVLARRELEGTFEDQITSADLLLVNKIDTVSESDLAEIETVLREFEPDAPVLFASFGRVEPAVLFPPDSADARRRRREEAQPAPPHTHEQFESEEVELQAGLEDADYEAMLSKLDALRIKGFVQGAAGLRLVQGVGPTITLSDPAMAPRPEMVGRVIAIRRKR